MELKELGNVILKINIKGYVFEVLTQFLKNYTFYRLKKNILLTVKNYFYKNFVKFMLYFNEATLVRIKRS